jgi:hypothetical protein
VDHRKVAFRDVFEGVQGAACGGQLKPACRIGNRGMLAQGDLRSRYAFAGFIQYPAGKADLGERRKGDEKQQNTDRKFI